MAEISTIETYYCERETYAAAYLLVDGAHAAFVETNANRAVPRLLEALSAAGRAPEDVDYVIVTHVHLDHAGGASELMRACPKATLIVHPRGAAHMIDPSKLVGSAQKVYGEEAFQQLYGTIGPIPAERVRTVEDEEVIELGATRLRFLHTRGHANHHVCVVDEAAGAVFTGDSFGVRYPTLQEEGLAVFPSTSPTDFDPAAAKESVARIAACGAERAFFTHYGETTALAEVAARLTEQLDDYAALIAAADDSGLEGQALQAHTLAGVEAIFSRAFSGRAFMSDPERRQRMDLDLAVNAQGVAFAVEKARYKRSKT